MFDLTGKNVSRYAASPLHDQLQIPQRDALLALFQPEKH